MSVRMAGGGANDEEIDGQLGEDKESRRGSGEEMWLLKTPGVKPKAASSHFQLTSSLPELSLRSNCTKCSSIHFYCPHEEICPGLPGATNNFQLSQKIKLLQQQNKKQKKKH